MVSIKQLSFAKGEVAPALRLRSDQATYASSLAELRNFQVMKSGGVTNRAGLIYVGEVKTSSLATKLIRFVFANDDAYVLEFGNQYARVYKASTRARVEFALTGNDAWFGGSPPAWALATAYVVGDGRLHNGSIYNCTVAHTSAAATEPGVGSAWGSVWVLHRYTAGEYVGATPSTTYSCKLAHTPTATTQPGVGATWTTYWHLLTAAPTVPKVIYEIYTPYVTADLSTLQYIQSGDVITICHPNYAPRELIRHAEKEWGLVELAFAPSIIGPTAIAGGGSAGAVVHEYAVTAIKSVTYEESLPGVSSATAINITAVAAAGGRRFLITAAAHGFVNGDYVVIDGIVGNDRILALNARGYRVGDAATNTFQIEDPEAGAQTGTYTSGGTVRRGSTQLSAAAVSTAAPVTLTWAASADATEYNVYRKKYGQFGYIGTTAALSFIDDGILPDLNETPPIGRTPFTGTGDYPSCVAYFQQRQLFANTNNEPETVYCSLVGSYHNLAFNAPALDDDAFSFTIAGTRMNRIRHIVDVGKLVMFTDSGEWTVQGDGDGVLRPTAINLHQEGFVGASTLPPVVIGNSALYVQPRGGTVRDLRYDFTADGYPTRDLTVYSSHLLEGHTLVDWDYAPNPSGVVWAVRDDGVMLGLTYVREHELVGWHVHDTDGTDTFENVAVVPYGDEDAVWCIVKRTINGVTKRYIEVMASRFVENQKTDAVFSDSCVRNMSATTASATSLTLTGGTSWVYTENLTLTASAALFTAATVGNHFRLTFGTTDVIVRVTAYTSATVVTVRATATVPVAGRGVATFLWGERFATLSSFAHLAGRTVSILGNGSVYPQQVVTAGGVLTFDPPAENIVAGLPIVASLETLDIEFPDNTVANKKKRVTDATIYVEASRGMWVGQDSTNMTEWKQRSTEAMGEPVALYTGPVEQRFPTTWKSQGKIRIEQRDPLPLTILAIIPTVQIGG